LQRRQGAASTDRPLAVDKLIQRTETRHSSSQHTGTCSTLTHAFIAPQLGETATAQSVTFSLVTARYPANCTELRNGLTC